jgi:hypothetical protein
MMVEGIYLISVVIAAYSSNKIKLWWFMIFGWGIPVMPLIPHTIFSITASNALVFYLFIKFKMLNIHNSFCHYM